MNCTKIKRIIDEADRPDVFLLEAAGHIAGCPDCQSFADERAKLRELTGSVARVTAPGNFNALLNERLSRVKSQRFSWLSPAGFLRVGTATAGLLVVFVALQYGGFLSPKAPVGDQTATFVSPPDRDAALPPKTPEEPKNFTDGYVPPDDLPARAASKPSPRTVNIATRTQRPEPQDGPSILVRDVNGDRAVPMYPVSLGMQQSVVNGSGRPQPRTSDISY